MSSLALWGGAQSGGAASHPHPHRCSLRTPASETCFPVGTGYSARASLSSASQGNVSCASETDRETPSLSHLPAVRSGLLHRRGNRPREVTSEGPAHRGPQHCPFVIISYIGT